MKVAWEDKAFGNRFSEIHSRFREALEERDPELSDNIRRQDDLVVQLCAINREIKNVRG